MAVGTGSDTHVSQASGARRLFVGTNVMVAVILAVAVVVVAQVIAYSIPQRWDMTSSGVNSLSEGTENLLRGLDANVRITSLYFETDREDEDQPRYRRSVQDLIDLYEATNRSKIAAEWVNPLKDREKLVALLDRLAEKTVFKEELGAYRERVDKYTNELDGQLRALIQSELSQIADADAGAGGQMSGGATQAALAPVEQLMSRLSGTLESTREQIDGFSLSDQPQYSAAKMTLSSLYRQVSKALKDVNQFGTEQLQRNPDLSPAESQFLKSAGNRYADLVAALEGEITKLNELEPLKFDDLVSQLQPTANPILVETDDDARVVDFSSTWPSVQQGAGAGFKSRAFKGEEKLTSAILRATHKEQTAVVFARYGGPPPFMGGFMPGQPPAPYSAMKQQLEDTNFIVRDWDLKTGETPPVIDPAPTRTIYVVMKPTAPKRGAMGRPSLEAPFGPNHREAVLKAVGESGRALFVAGWYPGPFGPIPSTYEYNDYLSGDWGIKVDTSALLLQAVSIAPGKYAASRNFYMIGNVEVSDHDIVSGAASRQVTLPWSTPLDLTGETPEGVAIETVMNLPARDGLWGVKDIQKYQQQLTTREYLTKVDGDLEGPFTLAVAATKDGRRPLIIDADERARGLTRMAGFNTEPGLTDIGSGSDFADSIHEWTMMDDTRLR
ncbi:MAG: Gldg family protein, partial [Planctomycetes bacterium]|nr:Gldg family protein [Planctomycetota bacterium]